MAKWRTNESFDDVKLDMDDASCVVKVNTSTSKYPVYELWQKVMLGKQHISVNYPGGMDKFREDAMRERDKMLREQRGV